MAGRTCILLCLTLAGTACKSGLDEFQAVPIPPLAVAPLDNPGEGTIAVMDFDDQRPPGQREEWALSSDFSTGPFNTETRYWLTQNEEASEYPVPENKIHLYRVRRTGTGSFAWYPHPNVGSQAPQVRPLSDGLADYIALTLEQRALANRIVRVRSLGQARNLGATHILEGTVYDFAGAFAERKVIRRHPADDPMDYELLDRLRITYTLRRVDDGEVVYQKEYALHQPDRNLFDPLDRFRGPELLFRIHTDDLERPQMIYRSMIYRVRQSLEDSAQGLLAGLEPVLAVQGEVH